ncbi:MAG: hypothetical protein ABUL57_03260, partial [Chloroflexota bacterium]
MIGLPHILATGLLTFGLTGCTVLDILLGSPPDPFDPDFSFPPEPTAGAEGRLSTGTATLTISTPDGKQVIVLDEVVGDSEVGDEYGTHVIWTNGEGWFVSLYAYPEEPLVPESAYLSIDRVLDSQHWVLADPTRCLTTMDPAPTAPAATAGATPGPVSVSG